MRTYRFYTSDGRRLAAYAKVYDVSAVMQHLHIVLIACSKKDNFSKRIADEAYLKWTPGSWKVTLDFPPKKKHLLPQSIIFHPKVVTVILEEGIDSKKQFLDYMTQNYYRIWTYPVKYDRTVLRHYGEPSRPCIPFGKDRKRPLKMSDY